MSSLPNPARARARTLAAWIAVWCGVGHADAGAQLSVAGHDYLQQTLQFNPAAPQAFRLSIALPAPGLSYHNTGFPYGDTRRQPTAEAEFRFATDRLRANSVLFVEPRLDVVGFALRHATAGTFSFGWSERGAARLELALDLYDYLLRGSTAGRAIGPRGVGVDDVDVDISAYSELAFGYQPPASDDGRTRYGARVKVLFGRVNAHLTRLSLRTRQTEATVDSAGIDYALRSSGFGSAFVEGGASTDVRKIIFAPANPGLAVDVGIHHRPSESWSFGASLLDLGAIRWERGLRTEFIEGNVQNAGVLGRTSPGAGFAEIIDSIEANFDEDVVAGGRVGFEEPTGGYTRALGARFVGRVERAVGGPWAGSLTYRGQRWAGRLYSAGQLGLHFRPGSALQLAATYGVDNGVYHLVGVSGSVRIGGVQVYGMVDDFLAPLTRRDLGSTAARLGANLLFGRERGGTQLDCFEF